MRVSVNWLREYVDFDLSPAELAERLTMAGFEVEHIEDRRAWADGVVVGKVLECIPHPQADRLRVCQVDIGTGTLLNIVCGAPNARADIYVPVATLGTYLPIKDLKLKPTALRGVVSEGMLCSLAELGLAKESEGIHIFEAPYPLGSDVRPILHLDDVILEVGSTANRADALSMVGIAREVAALTGGVLRLPVVEAPLVPRGSLTARVIEPEACPIYTATLLEGIKVGPSPNWLAERLEKAGMRPINAIVDITNYVLLEWGQPLHAFDADRLDSSLVGVRFARKGEKLRTLDGSERALVPNNLIITAGDRPVALAGVMGGEESEVSETTSRILLEAAIFDPVAVRRSARAFGLRTEASARYERGVDPTAIEAALDRTVALLIELSGAQPVAQARDDFRRREERTIELRPERFVQLMGAEVSPNEMTEVLVSLGFDVAPGEAGTLLVTVPGHRLRDIEREIDLIEEVARIIGYDRFTPTLPPPADGGFLPFEDFTVRQIRSLCQGAGLTEVVVYSLVPDRDQNPVAVSNPLNAELNSLRTNLIDGLLETLKYNRSQGNMPFHAFEIGLVFLRTDEGIFESERIAGVMCGDPVTGNWQKKAPAFDWFAAKGVLEAILLPWRLEVEYQADRQDERLHPGRTASLWVNGERLGLLGQVHPRHAAQSDIPEQTFVFELDLDLLLELVREQPLAFKPFSSYPASDRDLSFYARQEVPVFEFERLIRNQGQPLLESVTLLDEYRGPGVPDGHRSLAFRMVYRSDHTLTDQEVNTVHQRIRQALAERYEVELRS